MDANQASQSPAQENLIILFFKIIIAMCQELFGPLMLELSPPFLMMAPYLIIAGGISIVLLVIAFVLRVRFFLKQLQTPSVFLEVVPSDTTLQSQFSTEQLFTTLHTITEPSSWIDKTIGNKQPMSFELVSTKEDGIRYIIKTSTYNGRLIQKNLRAYLPNIEIREIEDYLPPTNKHIENKVWQIVELKLGRHFAVPLVTQAQLKEHDPIAYITGHMTQLSEGDLVSMQLTLTPVYSNTHPRAKEEIFLIKNAIMRGKDINPFLHRSMNIFQRAFKSILFFIPKLILFITLIPFQFVYYLASSDKRVEMLPFQVFNILGDTKRKQEELSSEELVFQKTVGEKVKSELYEVSLRFLVIGDTHEEVHDRVRGLLASLAPFEHTYQWLRPKYNMFAYWLRNIPAFNAKYASFQYAMFKHRMLSLTANPILSVSEVASLYHFPYTLTTKTEDIVKNKSPQLPAPLSLKKADSSLDVIFAKNTYGGTHTPIGLTQDERRRHMYVIGATGTGKSTLMLSMISQDLGQGKGIAVLDPHGELAEGVINCIPEDRAKDLIYFNPDDLKYPIGVNLLELTPDLDEDDALREKEFITESVISLFRKVFSDSFSGTGSPHRIEYILRNTIHTVFTTQDPTLFTVYDLLTNPSFRKTVVSNLKDEHLKNFWKYEFGKAGDYQQVKMISPITARIGRFLFSPSARRILEQKKSTINFDEILDTGKILVCNLAKGKLGEDTSEVLGIMILNKLQLAALKRARVDARERRNFYLYVDEFQNFATPSFVQMLSEARKYKLNLVMAEQSTSQQQDRSLVHIILANAGTVVSFRSANPIDEDLLLRQFAPTVKKGDISSLPAFHFYMKISVMNSQDTFSGETVPVSISLDKTKIDNMIQASRKHYAITYIHQVNEKIEDSSQGKNNVTTPKTTSLSKTPKSKKTKKETASDKPITYGLPDNE